jgi:hypothetical protein
VFALAAVERLVTRSAPEQEALCAALEVGWQLVEHGDLPWQTVREELEQRPDVDDDEVAAVCFALGAAGGSAEDAEWAAQRCMDAALERVSHLDDTGAFRPLLADTSSLVVREELHWQTTALDVLERDGANTDTIDRLRA